MFCCFILCNLLKLNLTSLKEFSTSRNKQSKWNVFTQPMLTKTISVTFKMNKTLECQIRSYCWTFISFNVIPLYMWFTHQHVSGMRWVSLMGKGVNSKLKLNDSKITLYFIKYILNNIIHGTTATYRSSRVVILIV